MIVLCPFMYRTDSGKGPVMYRTYFGEKVREPRPYEWSATDNIHNDARPLPKTRLPFIQLYARYPSSPPYHGVAPQDE